MFGGLAFMVNGHMCCGVLNDDLVLRVAREEYDNAISRPYVLRSRADRKPAGLTLRSPRVGRPVKSMERARPAQALIGAELFVCHESFTAVRLNL